MAEHRYDTNIKEIKTYFTTVIDWVSGVFSDVEKEMRGLEWGRLYEKYHTQSYDPAKVSTSVQKFYADPYVKRRSGIFEYILGGETETKLLEIRVFDEATKKMVYNKQTDEAAEKGISNCPFCAIGHEASKNKIWKISEMDADHVTAWSKGGATGMENCQVLCKPHNQAKGNK
jgi:hypothetical protein